MDETRRIMVRSAIVALHQAGKRPMHILRDLKNLKVTRNLVFRTVNRFKDTGAIIDRPRSGRPTSVTTPGLIKAVRARLARKSERSARQLAREFGVSHSTMLTTLKTRLHVRSFKKHKYHGITAAQKKKRLDRARALRSRLARGELPNIIFSDEKIFTLEQAVNTQNDRVWLRAKTAENRDQWDVPRVQGPAAVMVWAGVTRTGRAPLVFIPQGVRMTAAVYRELVLDGCLSPWANQHFGQVNGHLGQTAYTFQQDSAPAHTARATQAWLEANMPGFISGAEWPPYSPDLNPLDFGLWGILQARVSAYKCTTIADLKQKIQREWDRIPLDVVRDSCDAFSRRLTLVIKAKGGQFE
jgi:transposase